MNTGVWYAIAAYVIWAALVVYWKALAHVPAPQLLSHRIVWSFLFLLAFIGLAGRWRNFWTTIRNGRILRVYAASAALIGVNWLTYVWAVNAGFVVETSLGYFINPLLSVVLGVLFFHERLRPWQWASIGLAAAGVLYLTAIYRSLPWIALTLAFAFGFYGLVKKAAPLDSLYGLTLETGILFLPALAYLGLSEAQGQGQFLHAGLTSDALMIGAGLMTTIPLLLFAAATHRIPLSLVGILQYITPTVQFLLGVLVYHEPFSRARLLGFAVVWAALLIFAVESFLVRRQQQR